jgi:hypothetical protein
VNRHVWLGNSERCHVRSEVLVPSLTGGVSRPTTATLFTLSGPEVAAATESFIWSSLLLSNIPESGLILSGIYSIIISRPLTNTHCPHLKILTFTRLVPPLSSPHFPIVEHPVHVLLWPNDEP